MELSNEQLEHNSKYREACENQLRNWVSGKPIHNELNPFMPVVDEEGVIVKILTPSEGGECCPDFSCCGGEMWSESDRRRFSDSSDEVRLGMMMGSLKSIAEDAGFVVETTESTVAKLVETVQLHGREIIAAYAESKNPVIADLAKRLGEALDNE